ncbi:MAG TPA: type II secretion system major pseudopilin GspG [Steroidobacteraceae bacterium]|nr:type II secretion system major pseudopilin GspG [Steroidobacteraceae bacterium]
MLQARSVLPLSRRPARAGGFTLIEIMVVVVIIGLLAAMIVPSVVGHVEQARVVRARQDIQALGTALTMYRIDNFKYPTTDQGLQALVQRPADPTIRNWREGGYIQQGSLKDPWGNTYQYVYPGTHGHEYDLYSLGANGEEGSTDSSSVIGNWNLDSNGTSSSGGNGTGGAP